MLNDNQRKASEMYAKGEKVTDIARVIGVSRTTIYDWLKNDEFKADVDIHLKQMKSQAEKKVVSNIEGYLTELEKIALTSKSDKTRLDALSFLIDHVLGKSTTKVQDITEDKKKEDNINVEDILSELEDMRTLKVVK